ncbi:phosphotransferase family protein [Fusarium austroafricanum]|uniref:Phosphotransferase family protein n=1 Tax=Fusarium austroafricanum TaxID=2364996 RepID=A0A8H4KIL8_9HYPO|nr:phosphotransferase family protein [Fusarium austroafricanum]
MPSKPRFLCMDKDDIVWQELDNATDEWDNSIRTTEIYRAVGNLILQYRPGQPEVMHTVVKGGYNVIYRLEYRDGSSVIMRIPIKTVVPFPDKKVRYEAAVMRYIAANTTIPVPHVYHYATGAENPIGIGPFIIMDYIDHHHNMSRELLDPTRPIDKRPVLDPQISEEKLESLYGQMANILLHLSALKFPRIGSLVEHDDSVFFIHTNAPPGILPSQAYGSSAEWYSALADMHMAQSTFQHNDAVEDEDDARDKYTARQLFRNLVTEGRLMPDLSNSEGGFRLFSEDFRPANVLVDKNLRVVGVIDWEFAYAAPPEFSFDPPWWLLLKEPEDWPGGYKPWMEVYEPRLQTFLRVLEAEEKKMATANLAESVSSLTLGDRRETEPRLSQRMRESWEKRTWMINYAARKSWAFDCIWWKFLDESYFGPNDNQDYQARLECLSGPQRSVMESFFTWKMEDSRNQESRAWVEKDAEDRLAELLV